MKDRVKIRTLLLALGCLAALSVGIFALRGLANLASGGVTPPNASTFSADHGLPETIAGYRVLAVQTSETTACMRSGTARLVLQSDASNAQEAISMDVSAVYQELERLVPDSGLSWRIGIVGPNFTAAEIAVGNAQRNADYAENGCPPRLGGPIIILTPTELDASMPQP
jgi:hypothetical protein